MAKLELLIFMLFFHIVDDYYLQGWLASAKQKSWWVKNAPDNLYKNDYIMALAEHAFSWTIMIHFPVIIFNHLGVLDIRHWAFIVATIIFNWICHAVTDNAKANLKKINLIQDQTIHFVQIFATWIVYITT